MTQDRDVTRRSFLIGAAACGVLAVPLSSCGDGQRSDIVLFVTLELGNPFYVEMVRGLDLGISRSPGWVLERRAGRQPDDASGQREIMEAFLSRHSPDRGSRLRGLVIVPASSGLGLAASLRQFNAAQIPIINLDIPIDPAALQQGGVQLAAFIGSDNVEGGRVAASEMADQLPQGGNVLILMGVPGQANTRARRDGFVSRLTEQGTARRVTYRTREWTANWSQSEAITATDSLFASSDRPDAIFAENDLMALGAAQAIEGMNWSGRRKPTIIGYDAIPQAVEAVHAGRIHATVSQEPASMGEKAIDYLVRLSHGEQTQQREIVPVRLVRRA